MAKSLKNMSLQELRAAAYKAAHDHENDMKTNPAYQAAEQKREQIRLRRAKQEGRVR